MTMELYWGLWLLAIAATFVIAEAFALYTNRPTLSRTVWNVNKAWPPLGWLVGLIAGFLASHFFWPGQGCGL